MVFLSMFKIPKNKFSILSAYWNDCQNNYSTIRKEILLIVMCITKFQSDFLNQKLFLHIYCKSTKEVLQKDVQNIAL
jgi:hypothetical protein